MGSQRRVDRLGARRTSRNRATTSHTLVCQQFRNFPRRRWHRKTPPVFWPPPIRLLLPGRLYPIGRRGVVYGLVMRRFPSTST